MKARVTLKEIRSRWGNTAVSEKNNVDFCRAILPDAYDPAKSGDVKSCSYLVDNSTLRGFMAGNKKAGTKNGDSYSAARLTARLMQQLKSSASIAYLDPTVRKTCTKSMIDNVRSWAESVSPPIMPDHPLFTELSVSQWWADPDCEECRRICRAMERLLKQRTQESISYALFLLILVAIFRHHVSELEHLYNEEALRRIFDASNTLDKVYTRNHVPLEDPDYLDTDYHVYLYRSTIDSLYESGTLRMTVDTNGMSTAILSLVDSNSSAQRHGGSRPVDLRYRGTPVLDKADDIVYIVFKDEQNEDLRFLCFKYEQFSAGTMYYRTGLMISPEPRNRYPQVRRVCICSRAVDPEEIPVVKGMLQTNGSRLMLTADQLDSFMEEIERANMPWAREFREHYKPFIELHKKEVYVFDEAEILTSTLGEISDLDRMRIMLMLKAHSATRSSVVSTSDNTDFHKLVR